MHRDKTNTCKQMNITSGVPLVSPAIRNIFNMPTQAAQQLYENCTHSYTFCCTFLVLVSLITHPLNKGLNVSDLINFRENINS